MHSSRLLVLGPRRTGNVAAHDGFERHDWDATDNHGAFVEAWGIDGRGERGGEEMGLEVGEVGADEGEPVGGKLGKECAFGGDTLESVS